jgi:hypothetical protein
VRVILLDKCTSSRGIYASECICEVLLFSSLYPEFVVTSKSLFVSRPSDYSIKLIIRAPCLRKTCVPCPCNVEPSTDCSLGIGGGKSVGTADCFLHIAGLLISALVFRASLISTISASIQLLPPCRTDRVKELVVWAKGVVCSP